MSLNQLLREAEIQPHGVQLNQPDLSRESHNLGVTVRGRGRPLLFHVMFNSYWEPLIFELPPVVSGVHGPWRRWIDTYQDAPHDIYDWPGGAAGLHGASTVDRGAPRFERKWDPSRRSVEHSRRIAMTTRGTDASVARWQWSFDLRSGKPSRNATDESTRASTDDSNRWWAGAYASPASPG